MDVKENAEGLLREKQVLRLVPVSRATLWRWVASGRFPKPMKLGAITVWAVADVRAFVEAARQGASR